ncbi:MULTISPECIES: hypothetical protein [unclassified Flavobacterium]|uniref:hypothetical protein n=1 Tax=unclassified Flavobacterium TaxID=196869 RepID=UPI0012912EFC|nr:MULTISPECIES: hypothetical protein [unclassified Flavobacterium]MQP53284.1 hypothetical protein [Flavobacterium sp. LMO9]MQP63295.1 hypothetical protein [Flavobacterium sp. LMO6]
MKKKLSLLLFLISLFCYSQQKVKSGYITFNSNSNLYFKNLVIANDSVSFQNDADKEMSFSLKSIKKIVDNTGAIVYQPIPTKVETKAVLNDKKSDTIIKKDVVISEELRYKSASKIYLKDERLSSDKIEALLSKNEYALSQYKKGKSNALLGDILVGGGLGLFVGGGLANLSTANSGGSGSSTILIVGLVTAGVGIPVKISASKNIRESIDTYNSSLNKTTFIEKTNISIITNSKGLGLSISF